MLMTILLLDTWKGPELLYMWSCQLKLCSSLALIMIMSVTIIVSADLELSFK